MKTKLFNRLRSITLSCVMVFLLSFPSFSQVSNDNTVNYRVETVSFQYNDCEVSPLGIGTGITLATPVAFKVNSDCITNLTLPPTLPINFSDSEAIISQNNQNINTNYELELSSWANTADIPSTPCGFDRIRVDLSLGLGLAYGVLSDGCLREEVAYRSRIINTPGTWHSFSENVGPNTINFRQVWRYTNGDTGSSALDFGNFVNGTSKSHANSNRSISIGSITNKGYSNKFSGIASLNNSTDVVYKFTIGAAASNYRVEIDTDNSSTNFDSEIHLLNSNRTQVIARDDDGGTGLRSKLVTNLSPGTYFVVVEGAGNNSAEGDFVLRIQTASISPTPGSISQPSPAVFCSGSQLPAIQSNVNGGTNPSANANVSYKWFKRVGNASNFSVIPGAIGATLTAAQAGTMSGESVTFTRSTVLGSQESITTNNVTFTSTDQIGVMRLSSNTPRCAGQDGEFYIESESGTSDAGVIINYNINGSAANVTLDANGRATIVDPGLTASSTLTLVSSEDGGCTEPLTISEEIELFTTPMVLACGSSISGNNANGTTVANRYSGTYRNSPYPLHLAPGREDIYQFEVLGTTENVRISLTGLTDDLDLFLVSDCNILDFIEGSGNVDSEDEFIDINLPVGTYYVIVDADAISKTSPYTLTLESCGITSICDNIIDVACFETLIGEDNNTPFYFDCFSTTYNSTVYKIEPENSGTMNFNVTNSTTTQQLYLYDQFCDAGNCNTILTSTDILNPSLSFNVVGGTCYYLEVFGGSSPGTYDIEFDCPVTCPCATGVDYVEVVADGDVCIGNTGTYTIQPALGASVTPNGIVSYSLNGGATQTVSLDAAGMATISDTPGVVGNPGSTIVLSEIEVGPCSIQLDSEAEFNANGFPTSFTTSSNGPICSGSDTGFHTIQGNPGTSNPTPFANVSYRISFFGQTPPMPDIFGTVKLDETGYAEIPVPPTQAAVPSSIMTILSSEVNGCVTLGGGTGSITTYDPADEVTITANPTYCPGSDVVFTVTGTPGHIVEYDDTNNGSLPNGSGNANTNFIVLDGAGNGTITVANPTGDARVDIYTVIINPFGSNNNTFPFCKLFYEQGEKFAVSQRTEIGVVEIVNADLDICETESTFWALSAPGVFTPNGSIAYTLNGVAGTHIVGDAIIEPIFDTDPVPGLSTLTLNSIESNGCIINLSSSLTKTVVPQFQDVIVTAEDAQICAGETAVYNITPAPGASPNPAGTIFVYTLDNVNFITEALDANGEATISFPNQTTSSTMTLTDLSSGPTSACLLQLDSGASVDVIPFATPVSVAVESDICSDGIAEFRINPDPTPSPGASLSYTLDGEASTLVLDENGVGSIFVADESGMANDHTIVLNSISYFDCSIPLTATATLTCNVPCYEFQTRNFLEEEVVVYQVEGFIESTSTICAPAGGGTADVSYLAGTSVDLEPGFTVEPGCIFLADIDPCIAECPCGLVSSPRGSADVPNDVLRWKVNEDATCITDLESDQLNATADIEIDVKGYVTGSSGPVFADLSMRIDGSTDRIELENVVISTGQSAVQLGIYTSDNGDAYLVQMELNYLGTIVDATVVMSPWCITPPETACPTLGRTALAEAPNDILEFVLLEDPYCLIGIDNASNNEIPQISVDVKNFVGGNTDIVEVEVNFVSPTSGGAAGHIVNMVSGAGVTNIPTFVYTTSNGVVYDVMVSLEYEFLPAARDADLVEVIIFVTPQ
jgi:hypothetical protein